MVPSGNVVFTVEPGSAVPATVMVPFGLAVVVAVGATGGVLSTAVDDVAGETLPAGSVAVVETGPEVCGVGEVIAYCPLAGTTAVPVVPSGNVVLMVEPGSAVPATVMVPLGLDVVVAVGATGGVASTKGTAVAGDVLPAGSEVMTDTGPEV